MKRFRNNAGYTILEVAFAASIMVIVLGSMMALTARGYRYMLDTRRASGASQALHQKIEDLREMTWSQLQSLPSTFTSSNSTLGVYSGTIKTNVYDTVGGTATVLKVTLTVSYTNQSSGSVSNNLTTLFTNNGMNNYIR